MSAVDEPRVFLRLVDCTGRTLSVDNMREEDARAWLWDQLFAVKAQYGLRDFDPVNVRVEYVTRVVPS